ncbi:hypothetical protein [Caulobacter sp. NIBR1757]|uniref:hypothetical protein n=1 Tax=Caulobacter sp. NIBR1757 TaxID=3016000 RepID=UPI0022EFF198|nr:hypothetical protein [Caulobacter sp. NIBR1757]
MIEFLAILLNGPHVQRDLSLVPSSVQLIGASKNSVVFGKRGVQEGRELVSVNIIVVTKGPMEELSDEFPRVLRSAYIQSSLIEVNCEAKSGTIKDFVYIDERGSSWRPLIPARDLREASRFVEYVVLAYACDLSDVGRGEFVIGGSLKTLTEIAEDQFEDLTSYSPSK